MTDEPSRKVTNDEIAAFYAGQKALISDNYYNMADWALKVFSDECPQVKMNLERWRTLRTAIINAFIGLWPEEETEMHVDHNLVWRHDNDYPFEKPDADDTEESDWPAHR